ncbi:alkaline phosphatase D [Streptomyces sp. 1222.5]|nr:PhoD-like phosphatase [Streptomyces sp. 5112.2]SEC80114.1 alkaline phosphatase D [Streptomyces sp. 1222.5]
MPPCSSPAGSGLPMCRQGPCPARVLPCRRGTSALPDGVFTLGVTSGDPLRDGIVLWTRLAPDPLNGGGMPDTAFPVEWEPAEDERFHRITRRGLARARPELGHPHQRGGSLRVALAARTGSTATSRRTRTCSPRSRTSCSSSATTSTSPRPPRRPYGGTRATGSRTPWQYRNRPRPRRDARRRAWVVAFDDHEVDDDWAGEMPQDPGTQSHDAFQARLTAAFQAYCEHIATPCWNSSARSATRWCSAATGTRR